MGVIVAGDLNECHDEFFRRNAGIISALLPDDPFCAMITEETGQNDFIVIAKNNPPVPVHFPQNTIILYSPWTTDLINGTYYYRNTWETIDHFLISPQFFNDTGWKYNGAEIVNYGAFANQSGMPTGYNVRTGYGLSDHLPLIITLKK